MTRLTSMLFAGLIVALVAAGAAERNAATFRASVQEIVMLGRYSGPVRVVHFDPRFVITLRIETGSLELPEFVVGETVAFAIHSPTSLFTLEREVAGKTFTFSVVREVENGVPRFSLLEVVRETEADAPPGATGAPGNP
jgi:hypothetical protein